MKCKRKFSDLFALIDDGYAILITPSVLYKIGHINYGLEQKWINCLQLSIEEAQYSNFVSYISSGLKTFIKQALEGNDFNVNKLVNLKENVKAAIDNNIVCYEDFGFKDASDFIEKFSIHIEEQAEYEYSISQTKDESPYLADGQVGNYSSHIGLHGFEFNEENFEQDVYRDSPCEIFNDLTIHFLKKIRVMNGSVIPSKIRGRGDPIAEIIRKVEEGKEITKEITKISINELIASG
ncbi:MAG: hypothetical protein ABIG10_03110 [bacterium]